MSVPIARRDTIRLGLVGTGYMARAHSAALTSALTRQASTEFVLSHIAGRRQAAADAMARAYGWALASDDWRAVACDPDVDAVLIVTPTDAHADAAIVAAQHGKHVLCEKPLSRDATSAAAMVCAARQAGVINQVGFALRRWPAISLAKELLSSGRIGKIVAFRAHRLDDEFLDVGLHRPWRLSRARAGSGALSDLGSHVIDLGRFLVGDIVRVVAALRPRTRQADDVESGANLLLEFACGAHGAVEASWAAPGHKTDLGFEVLGDQGSIRFSWRRPGELELFLATDEPLAGFRSIVVHGTGTYGAPGTTPGFDTLFSLQARHFLESIAAQRPASPDFTDGLHVCKVVDSALESDRRGTWVAVGQ